MFENQALVPDLMMEKLSCLAALVENIRKLKIYHCFFKEIKGSEVYI